MANCEKTNQRSFLEEIEDFLEGDHSISSGKVIEWMQSEDIEVQGAVLHLCNTPQYCERIHPSLPIDMILPFRLNYLRRCLLENPQGEWSDSRYSAAHSLNNWFKYLWLEKERNKNIIYKIKIIIENLYKYGDDGVRLCIVHGILEHLFESFDLAEYFRDWQNDPILRVGYQEAMEWGQGHWVA